MMVLPRMMRSILPMNKLVVRSTEERSTEERNPECPKINGKIMVLRLILPPIRGINLMRVTGILPMMDKLVVRGTEQRNPSPKLPKNPDRKLVRNLHPNQRSLNQRSLNRRSLNRRSPNQAKGLVQNH